ncbi:uncharacterized protein Dmul_02910 [Desulfococcus multivorans]|nr:uncharacterized protein Dmul_02910 [Desulfococcus multivorans]
MVFKTIVCKIKIFSGATYRLDIDFFRLIFYTIFTDLTLFFRRLLIFF